MSYLIDFLPSYLFPLDERTISQWIIAGKSLGGHSSWIALTHGKVHPTLPHTQSYNNAGIEPRLSIAIPIIACPDYTKLITKRAKYSHIPLEPPYFPASLRAVIERNDPARAGYTADDASKNPFYGKKVLVLSGGDDPLVPFIHSQEFVEKLNVGPSGVKEVVVTPGVGHECTAEMVKQMASFVYKHALRV